jgi:hypothetical protein
MFITKFESREKSFNFLKFEKNTILRYYIFVTRSSLQKSTGVLLSHGSCVLFLIHDLKPWR